MKTVIKRDGTQVSFNGGKIKTAIENAMLETKAGIDSALAGEIAAAIEKQVERSERMINVEDIQDLVEDFLMASERKDAAKKFIIYRYERDRTRDARKRRDGRIISEEFASKFKHTPTPMNQLGSFVYYRTYSRWVPEEMRREYWWETVRRSVEYNCSLVPTSKEEAEKLYKNVFDLKTVFIRTDFLGRKHGRFKILSYVQLQLLLSGDRQLCSIQGHLLPAHGGLRRRRQSIEIRRCQAAPGQNERRSDP